MLRRSFVSLCSFLPFAAVKNSIETVPCPSVNADATASKRDEFTLDHLAETWERDLIGVDPKDFMAALRLGDRDGDGKQPVLITDRCSDYAKLGNSMMLYFLVGAWDKRSAAVFVSINYGAIRVRSVVDGYSCPYYNIFIPIITRCMNVRGTEIQWETDRFLRSELTTLEFHNQCNRLKYITSCEVFRSGKHSPANIAGFPIQSANVPAHFRGYDFHSMLPEMLEPIATLVPCDDDKYNPVA